MSTVIDPSITPLSVIFPLYIPARTPTNNEQVLPAFESSVFDLKHAIRKQTAESSSYYRTPEEQGDPQPQFATGIEQSQHEDNTGKKPRFESPAYV